MSASDHFLSKILEWAQAEPNIRCVVLVGSRARSQEVDALADFDVQIYARTTDPYTLDETWLSHIRPVWLVLPEQYHQDDLFVPTRLVIFAGGTKVDFAFYPATAVVKSVSVWPAYRVLVDKDGTVPQSAHRTLSLSRRPSAADFANVVREFWFEAYHVAKYLARNDLWLVKARDWATKQPLLTAIEWHEQARNGPQYETQWDGKGMQAWVSAEIWEKLNGVFAPFDRKNSWEALLATIALFRGLCKDLASMLDYEYPDDMDANISGFIHDLYNQAASES
jgi:aminoglycoside 6-adenylyltransferase